MTNHYCPKCGLEFRGWVEKLKEKVCDVCDPDEFEKLHGDNIRAYKKRLLSQTHITENTSFLEKKDRGYVDMKKTYNRREQK